MFLIAGTAFVMKLSYGPNPRELMRVVFDKNITGTRSQGFTGFETSQGMRILHDESAKALVVSVSCRMPPNLASFEFGMVQTNLDGDVIWARIFPASHTLNGIAYKGIASHPYALTGAPDSSGYVIGGLAVIDDGKDYSQGRFRGYTQGRLAKVSPKGEFVFDQRLQSNQRHTNIECYGVSPAGAGDGYILACGTGVEPEVHPEDPEELRTWMALVHRTDLDGKQLWQRNYSSNKGPPFRNNAGEYIITTKEGGYAVFLDSQSCGNPNSGGNFGLLLLDKDNATTSGAIQPSEPSETGDVSAGFFDDRRGNTTMADEDTSPDGDAWRQKMWARRRAQPVFWARSASASTRPHWLTFHH